MTFNDKDYRLYANICLFIYYFALGFMLGVMIFSDFYFISLIIFIILALLCFIFEKILYKEYRRFKATSRWHSDYCMLDLQTNHNHVV